MADDLDLDALLESALDEFTSEAAPRRVGAGPGAAGAAGMGGMGGVGGVGGVPLAAAGLGGGPGAGGDAEELLAALGGGDVAGSLAALLGDSQLKGELEEEMAGLMAGLNLEGGGGVLEQLAAQFQGLAQEEAAAPAGGGEAGLEEALQQMMEGAKGLQQGQGGEDMLASLLQGLEQSPELMEVMEGLMDKFMSKEVLHDSMRDMHANLEAHVAAHGSAGEEQVGRWRAQLAIMERVLALYKADDEPQPEAVQALLQEMYEVGELPEEVLQGMKLF